MDHDATSITKLLAKKHKSDVFVPECNCGSAFAGCRRMDAWVLCTTWSQQRGAGEERSHSR
jgi:hypothetical protein